MCLRLLRHCVRIAAERGWTIPAGPNNPHMKTKPNKTRIVWWTGIRFALDRHQTRAIVPVEMIRRLIGIAIQYRASSYINVSSTEICTSLGNTEFSKRLRGKESCCQVRANNHRLNSHDEHRTSHTSRVSPIDFSQISLS